MNNCSSSQPITVELGPTFGANDADIDRIRNSQVNWFDMGTTADFIFALEIPLEVVGVAASPPANDSSLGSPPSSLTFAPRDVTVRGITPDSSVRNLLLAGGEMQTSVDSLSRSILVTSGDERSFLNALRKQAEIDTKSLDALKRALLVPSFYDKFSDAAADRARRLLATNIRRHELNHVNCLINPETALWREFELYWRSILVGAKPRTWRDPAFLNRFARLYATPSYFVIELLAMMSEDYTRGEPSIKRTVETSVASRRGAAGELMRFVEEHNIDSNALRETLRSPVGEQFCDLWLAYVLNELRDGCSLSEISEDKFHNYCLTALDSSDDIICDPETRALFIDFMRERCFGPVFEVVRLDVIDERFVLERAWYSLNPDVSDAGSRLAVRRALYRRQFLSLFGSESGLNDVRSDRETAVERVIRGASLDEVALFDLVSPSTEQLSESLVAAHEATAAALLGSQATSEDLHIWLNDPDYSIERP